MSSLAIWQKSDVTSLTRATPYTRILFVTMNRRPDNCRHRVAFGILLVTLVPLVSGCDLLPNLCNKRDLIARSIRALTSASTNGEVVVEAGTAVSYEFVTANIRSRKTKGFQNDISVSRVVNGQVVPLAATRYSVPGLEGNSESRDTRTVQFNEGGGFDVELLVDAATAICEASESNNGIKQSYSGLPATSPSPEPSPRAVIRVRVVDTGKADPARPAVEFL